MMHRRGTMLAEWRPNGGALPWRGRSQGRAPTHAARKQGAHPVHPLSGDSVKPVEEERSECYGFARTLKRLAFLVGMFYFLAFMFSTEQNVQNPGVSRNLRFNNANLGMFFSSQEKVRTAETAR